MLDKHKWVTCGNDKCTVCNDSEYESKDRCAVAEYLSYRAKEGTATGMAIDIGAHTGLWSLSLSATYFAIGGESANNTMVYAIEPFPSTFEALKINMDALAITPVTCLPIPLLNKRCRIRFDDKVSPAQQYVTESQHAGTMHTVTLDQLAKANYACDFVKLDVEGAELLVLNGAREFLAANERMMLCVELCAGNLQRYGQTKDQLLNFLLASGFQYYTKLDKRRAGWPYKPDAAFNVLFVKGK